MDSGLVRLLIVAALFLLLAGDYAYLLSHLTGVFGSETDTEAADTDAADNKESSRESTAQLALVETSKFAKAQMLATMKNSCLPKLICELNAMPQKDKLTDSEKALLSLISDTTISTTAEVTSKYHFAAHMGQLIAGVDGTGCHNFYPSCPFPGVQVLGMIKNIRLRGPS